MTPAKDVGGDFYDLFQIDENRFGFVIADVSGKGIPASLFMAVSRTLLRATGLRGVSSAECINYVNKLLCKEGLDAMFVTAFYGIYDCRSGVTDYTNAGHTPPYIIRHDHCVEAVEMDMIFVMGVFDDFHYVNGQFILESGDTLVLYTDGVTEAFNSRGEQFAESGLMHVLETLPEEPEAKETVGKIVDSVYAHAGEQPQSDDITLLVIKRVK